ncbi:hypothetical protein [Cellulosimicrobium sp. CUA-896]|uniref:hypothetical protein n=1 Tax=Cellulosimicrobium sp. CUA-896 TaxID=1517881 RepID=UPI00096557C7|nr:hypothetical protein [Cellulosimicrobium sp. CUA-896]OLT54456.1 hypothetical protein BJF88_08920 [Cellulosimicrobium sp. CUA-896]
MTVPVNDDQGPIATVHAGMKVVDADGEEVGTVEDVRMGDGGVTANDEPHDRGAVDELIGAVRDAVTTGDGIPEAERARLERAGYLRIDAVGFLSGNRYAAADEIAAVEGDVVRLTVPGARLVG